MENTLTLTLADGGKRAMAFLIDFVIYCVIMSIAFAVAFSMGIGGAAASMDGASATDDSYAAGLVVGAMAASGIVQILGLVLWFAYHILMETSDKQATIGKSVMGLKVGNLEDGSKMAMGTAVIRNIVKYICVAFCFVGILVGFFTQNKQGLQDMAAKTNVFTK